MKTDSVNIKCAYCHVVFSAKKEERERGWARYCSKSCAAKKSTYDYKYRKTNVSLGPSTEGWDWHK